MDVVITYVNGLDPLWRDDYSRITQKEILSKRYRDWGTLKFLLRGLEEYMPYIRKVHLVVARESQVPEWIDPAKVNIVLHKDIIPEEYLPTFNSSMIEMFLHRIEGLDERFVYFNDDMFPVRPVPESTFFKDGKAAIGFSKVIFRMSDYKKLVFMSNRLARAAMGMKETWYAIRPQHICSPMLKSCCEELYSKVQPQILASLSPLRDKKNYNQYLFLDYMYCTGKAVSRPISVRHFSLGASRISRICAFLDNPSRDFACINDVTMSQKRYLSCRERILEAFERRLPKKSSFEKK